VEDDERHTLCICPLCSADKFLDFLHSISTSLILKIPVSQLMTCVVFFSPRYVSFFLGCSPRVVFFALAEPEPIAFFLSFFDKFFVEFPNIVEPSSLAPRGGVQLSTSVRTTSPYGSHTTCILPFGVELNPRPLNTDFTTDARISLTSWKFPHPRLKNVVDVLGRKKSTYLRTNATTKNMKSDLK